MPCLVALLALISPRLALVAVWLLTNWLDRAFETWLLPLLGFLLIPWTTLGYAFFYVTGSRGVEGFEWLIILVALLADLGSSLGGLRGRR
jgi:hypothetical protein